MKHLILFFLAIFTLTSCSRDNDESATNNSIVGVWNNSNQEIYSYTFTAEGRFYTKVKNGGDIVEADNGTYTFDGSTLKTKFIDYYQDGNPVIAEDTTPCKVEGNIMKVEGSIEYNRR